ncbi:hypothetical protein [Photobacterium sp. DNB22_13_2]
MDVYQTMLVAAATGCFSASGAGIAMKTNIVWIKKTLEHLDKRISKFE